MSRPNLCRGSVIGNISVSKTDVPGSWPGPYANFEVRGIVGGPVLLAVMGDVTGEPSLIVNTRCELKSSSPNWISWVAHALRTVAVTQQDTIGA